MPSKTVKACPACDLPSLRSTTRRADHDYRCNRCGETTDEPVVRERRGDNSVREDTLAGTLDAMDPGDLGGGEA